MLIQSKYEEALVNNTPVFWGRKPWAVCEDGFRLTDQGGCVKQALFDVGSALNFVERSPVACSNNLVTSPSVCDAPVDPWVPETPVPIAGVVPLLLIGGAALLAVRKLR